MKEVKPYGPDIRISLETDIEIQKLQNAYNVNMPNPKTDPIVVNNISTSEFDYIK